MQLAAQVWPHAQVGQSQLKCPNSVSGGGRLEGCGPRGRHIQRQQGTDRRLYLTQDEQMRFSAYSIREPFSESQSGLVFGPR